MKTWFEFPPQTRFARSGRADILYTPIYFANEPIRAKFCLDNEFVNLCSGDFSQFEARVKLIGKASLGFLSIGGRPVSALDTRYALPSVGFRPIYTLTIMDLERRVDLTEEDNVVFEEEGDGGTLNGTGGTGGTGGFAGSAIAGTGKRTPFQFKLQTSTLNDLQQIASSLKSVTADTASTMDLFKEVSPALIVSVQYALVGTLHYKGEKKTEHDSEIRIFVSMDESQVPSMTPNLIGNNPLMGLSQTTFVQLGKSKGAAKSTRRRDSLPLIRRMSRSNSSASIQRATSSVEEDSYLVIEIENSEPFCFRTRDEAAAAKFVIKLTYHDTATESGNTVEDDLSPPKMTANATTFMKALTSLTLEPVRPEGRGIDESLPDDHFHLRSKIFPLKKAKLTFGEWRKVKLTSAAVTAAQNMMQSNTDSTPTMGALGDYRLRRTSTLPTPAPAIGEEDSTEASSQVNTNPSSITISPLLAQAEMVPSATAIQPTPVIVAQPQSTLTTPSPPKRWTTTTDLWLTHPITSTLTPSFTTPYINHLYTVSITLNLNPDISSTSSPAKAKAFKALKSTFNPTAKTSIEFNVPVSVRYDLGLVPSYEVDGSLPEYDFSLPGYDDAVGFNPGALESLQETSTTEVTDGENGSRRANGLGAVEVTGAITGLAQPIEDVAAYEARITASNTAGADTTSRVQRSAVTTPDSQGDTIAVGHGHNHAWRYANVNSAAGDDADDDVLDMLMRNSNIGQGGRTNRRVYGDQSAADDGEDVSQEHD